MPGISSVQRGKPCLLRGCQTVKMRRFCLPGVRETDRWLQLWADLGRAGGHPQTKRGGQIPQKPQSRVAEP